MKNHWWKILIGIVAFGVILGWIKGWVGLPALRKPPVPPPVGGKIKGLWSSEGTAFEDLNDAKQMKAMGINTITFSPWLKHDQEGRVLEVAGSESSVLRTINKAHRAGIRVMLETTPMNMGVVNPRVTNPDLFTSEMTKYAIKYAKIAQEYKVEFFAPIVEPGHHLDDEVADKWLQNLLPQLRQVYKGKIIWKKQATDLEHAKPWNQNHILTLGFKLNDSELKVQLKQEQQQEHNISLRINQQTARLEEYSKQSNLFSQTKNVSLSSGWHELKITIAGNLIDISIDNDQLFEKRDDSGPLGGYAITGPTRINKAIITDLAGAVLFKEGFVNLNSWSAPNGLTLQNGEIVVPAGSDAKLIHDTDFSGYDYIAIDTFHRGRVVTIDQYIEFLRYYLQKTLDQAKADGVPKVMIAEFGGSLKENIGWKDADERAKLPLTEDELAQTAQQVLELAEGKVDGYIYNGWNINKQGLNQLPKVKKVVKDWYLSH